MDDMDIIMCLILLAYVLAYICRWLDGRDKYRHDGCVKRDKRTGRLVGRRDV